MMIARRNTFEVISMKKDTQKTKWLIDAGIFSGLWLASMLDLTGLALHQWLGLAVGLAAGYHLLSHWTWVKSVTQRWLGRTSSKARLYYLVDAGLLMGFSLILLTGLVMSTWFDLSLQNYTAWRNLHVTATVATLILTVIKVGIHGRWIVSVARRSIWPAGRQVNPAPVLRPTTAPVDMGRRDFLKLMGVVGGTALIASISAMNGGEESPVTSASAAQAEAAVGTYQSGLATDSYGLSSSSGQCSVRCNRRCSYPGHCRRYTDTNGNGRCDLGECA